MILPEASCGVKRWLELRVNTKCVCFACQEVLCRGSARAGQGKSPFLHPLSVRERQSGRSCGFLSAVPKPLDLWSCTASKQPVQILPSWLLREPSWLHGEHGCPGKWLIPGWNPSVWRGHGEGQGLGCSCGHRNVSPPVLLPGCQLHLLPGRSFEATRVKGAP